MKKVCLLLSAFVFIQNTGFAAQNYSYTVINDTHYNASSPVGYSATYSPYSANITNAYPGYYGYTQAMPETITYIQTPQSYDSRNVTTQIYRDEREGIDKAIDRSGKILSILGIGTLFGIGAAAIINAF